MTTEPITPSILEADLAEQLGVGRAVLTELRVELLTEADFTRKKGGIAYYEATVEKVCAHLHLEAPALSAETEPEPTLILTVTRRAARNRHVIFAAEKKDGPEIAVRVRDAAAFVPGQEIHAEMQGNVAFLTGPQPRRRRTRRLA